MRVAIHQPEYLGYLGFYNKMMNAHVWIYLDNVQLAKRDFVRRNRILGPTGAIWLSVPVFMKGRFHQLISEVEIDNSRSWRKDHWLTIEHQYAHAPFFNEYADSIAAIYESEWQKLADLNIALINLLAHLMGIERPTYRASELGVTGKRSQLLAELTEAVGGSVYLSGPMGRDYLDENEFTTRGLAFQYNDFTHPVYPQYGSETFVPYLAVIDLLFNCGPASRDIIYSGSELGANWELDTVNEQNETRKSP